MKNEIQTPDWMLEANQLWNWIVNGDQPVKDTIRDLSVKLEFLWHNGFTQGYKMAERKKE